MISITASPGCLVTAAGTHAYEGVIVGILELLSNAAHSAINSGPTTLLLLLLRRRVTSSPEPLDSAGPSYCRGDHRHLTVKDSIDSFLCQIAHTLVYLISPQWIWGSAELQTLLNRPHIATQVSLELQAPGAANMLDYQQGFVFDVVIRLGQASQQVLLNLLTCRVTR
jgi:hypothetical protein